MCILTHQQVENQEPTSSGSTPQQLHQDCTHGLMQLRCLRRTFCICQSYLMESNARLGVPRMVKTFNDSWEGGFRFPDKCSEQQKCIRATVTGGPEGHLGHAQNCIYQKAVLRDGSGSAGFPASAVLFELVSSSPLESGAHGSRLRGNNRVVIAPTALFASLPSHDRIVAWYCFPGPFF